LIPKSLSITDASSRIPGRAIAEFASVVDAVRCAAEIQRGMANKYRRAAGQADRTPHRIHVGDIVIEENDIFGDGVNIAVRLKDRGAGGISISDDARRKFVAR